MLKRTEFIEYWKETMGHGDTSELLNKINQEIILDDHARNISLTYEEHVQVIEAVADALGLDDEADINEPTVNVPLRTIAAVQVAAEIGRRIFRE